MDKKSLKASSAIILIIIISLLSISILFMSYLSRIKVEVVEYSIDSRQGKFIAESYRDYYCNELIKSNDINKIENRNLFSQLDYQIYKSIDLEDLSLNKGESIFPRYQVKINSIYKDIESYSIGHVDIYNSLLSLGYPEITMERISKSYSKSYMDDFNILKEKFLSSMEDFIPISDSYIQGRYSLKQVNMGGQDTYNYPNGQSYSLSGSIINGSDNEEFNSPEVNYYSGIIYNEGDLILEADFILNGIFISNNGRLVNSDRYDFKVYGLFIELGDQGSYPNSQITYNPRILYVYSKDKEWAKNYKINKRFNSTR